MKINKKLILLSTIVGSLLLGCSAKEIQPTSISSDWKSKLNKSNQEECQGDKCLASIGKPLTFKESVDEDVVASDEKQHLALGVTSVTIEYDYSDAPLFMENSVDVEKIASVGDVETIDVVATNDVAVQVGAFRKLSGAKKYAKRYSLLNSQYFVHIKKDFKDSQPLYRVQLNGFVSQDEATSFIKRYGTQGAFLVRK